MDINLNLDPGENPAKRDMAYDSHPNRWPQENSDSKTDSHPKHPWKNKNGRNFTDHNSKTTENAPMQKQENQNVVLINLRGESEA